ncbi:alpha/beta hydrolase [Litoreibacter roseus]|uniref:Esterase n=1 Tax=Litoreibacter roseus TaxID=2601869 RepID=A0A6N6JIG0_9RHOB|nr:alpha/beta hydrolase [Litoreibacter roseus]GFE65199.1 esterase [Litoreibacter roseus]
MKQDAYLSREKAPEDDAPLVFAFHGTGGDENQFFGLVEQLMPCAGIVSPRGDVSEQGANRFFKRTGEGVYDMSDLHHRTEKMTDFIRDRVGRAGPRPVYGIGYSNGANILASVALAYPEMFDRIALLHPLIPWTPEPVSDLAGRRVLITAGQSDPICPWPLSGALISYFQDQEADVTSAVHEGGHEIRPMELEALGDFLNAS